MISDEIIADLGPHVAVEGFVTAAESCVDLSVPGPGLVDRLELTGSDRLLSEAETVSERDIRARCIELAHIVDERVRSSSAAADAQIAIRRSRRAQMLAALRSGRPVPPGGEHRIDAPDVTRSGHRMSAAVTTSVFAGDADRLPGSDISALALLERRADELLALATGPMLVRQVLRDALYVYGEVEADPLVAALRFDAGPPAAVVTVDSAASVPVVVNGSAADRTGGRRRA